VTDTQVRWPGGRSERTTSRCAKSRALTATCRELTRLPRGRPVLKTLLDSTVRPGIADRVRFAMPSEHAWRWERLRVEGSVDPDVVLADADSVGVALSRFAGVPILGVFEVGSPNAVHRLIRAGCLGLVESRASNWTIASALAALCVGERFASPAALEELSGLLDDPDLEEELEPSQIRIIQLLADGAKTEEIASILRVHPNTVKGQLRRAVTKLGVSGRASAVAACMERGWIS
jgi:DNA-binding NarL/FixJ family response regulator